MLHISSTNFLNLQLKQNTAIGNNIECVKGGMRGKIVFLCSIFGMMKKRESKSKMPITESKHANLSGNTLGLYA